jgi:hypothetical protein
MASSKIEAPPPRERYAFVCTLLFVETVEIIGGWRELVRSSLETPSMSQIVKPPKMGETEFLAAASRMRVRGAPSAKGRIARVLIVARQAHSDRTLETWLKTVIHQCVGCVIKSSARCVASPPSCASVTNKLDSLALLTAKSKSRRFRHRVRCLF